MSTNEESREEKDAQGIEVPADKLSKAALLGVIDEFITREGTDYGHSETDLRTKRAQVRAQLECGEALLLFDPKTESVNLVLRHR